MTIDPDTWMLTLPVVLVLLAAAAQPKASPVKRWWCELAEAERLTWDRLTGRGQTFALPPAWRTGLLCAATTALALGTLLSMARHFGVLG